MTFYDLLLKTESAKQEAAELGLKTFEFKELQPGEISKSYDPQKIVFVKGGHVNQNKKTVKFPCDVLLDPHGGFDTALLQVAKDNDVSVGISLHQFLYSQQLKRVGFMVSYRKLLKLCQKMGVKVLLVSGATNNFEVRPPEQLASMGVFLGLTPKQAKWSISQVPEYLISKKDGEKK
jgi:RNase P/RNase MRP subunit p30